MKNGTALPGSLPPSQMVFFKEKHTSLFSPLNSYENGIYNQEGTTLTLSSCILSAAKIGSR